MALINRDSIDRDASENPFLGQSPEELSKIRAMIEGQIGQKRKESILGAINKGASDLGSFVSNRPMYMPKSSAPTMVNKDVINKTSDLNDFITKEKIKAALKNPTAPGTDNVPEGYAAYGGKLYKLPVTAENKPKTIKERALEALATGSTLEGLSAEETKKIAGVYIPAEKPSAAEAKRNVEETKLSDELGGLLSSYGRARQEGLDIQGFGKPGIMGRFAGLIAKGKGKAGYLPAINVYNDQRKAFATVVAKAAGEVRPTDEDINRFVATLPDTGKSDAENELLIQDINDKVARGDIGALWKGKSRTNQPIPTDTGEGQTPMSASTGGNTQYVRTGIDQDTGRQVGMLPDGTVEFIQ